MGTLTIRTTPEQDQVIEEVQKLMNESAVSKTLLRSVIEYQKLSSTVEEKSTKLKNALNRVNELESLIRVYFQSQHALMSVVSQTTSVAPRTGKCANPTDREQAQRQILGLMEIFKVSS